MIRTFIVEIDDSLRGAENDIFKLERAYGAEEVKTGHWNEIKVREHLARDVLADYLFFGSDEDEEFNAEDGTIAAYEYHCSECDKVVDEFRRTKFCPNCGARMIEPQESEVSE